MTAGGPTDSSAPGPARRTNLDRIAAILPAFDPKNTPLTSRALVDRAGASQATGFGLLRALARAGLLERVDHGLFRLGARAAGFAFAPLAWPADRQTAGSAPADPAADRGIPEQDWSDRLVRTVDCGGLERPMGAAPNTYDKAVRRFLALMDAPLDAPYTSPRSMAVAQCLPPGSGAGGVGILESHALLRRDNDGAYLRGSIGRLTHPVRSGGCRSPRPPWNVDPSAPVRQRR